MEIFKLEDMKGGWFVGNFEPTVYATDMFEVCYKRHAQGEYQDAHYHKQGLEINYLIEGEMKIQNHILKAGDIFIIRPYEIADPVFYKDCAIMVVKTPSIPGDKYII